MTAGGELQATRLPALPAPQEFAKPKRARKKADVPSEAASAPEEKPKRVRKASTVPESPEKVKAVRKSSTAVARKKSPVAKTAARKKK